MSAILLVTMREGTETGAIPRIANAHSRMRRDARDVRLRLQCSDRRRDPRCREAWLRSLADLSATLGVATCCGRCTECARSVLAESLAVDCECAGSGDD